MGETSKKQEPQEHNLKATVRAEITESKQPSLRRGYWKVWAKGATPGANELMLNELIQSKQQTIDPAFQYDQNTVYLAYVNTIQSPGDIQLGLFFDDFQSIESETSPVVKLTGEDTKGKNIYEVYLAGPSSIKYPFYTEGKSTDIKQTDKMHSNMQSVSVCNNWSNIRPLNGHQDIEESPAVSFAMPKDDSTLYQTEFNKRSQIYKTYLSEFVYPLTSRYAGPAGKQDILDKIRSSDIYDKYNYQNRDIFVHLISGEGDAPNAAAEALASLLILKANSSAYKTLDQENYVTFEDVKLNLTLESNSPIFNNTISRSESGEYNSKETLGDPKIGFQWYYPKKSDKGTDYIIQFGVPELCCEFVTRNSVDKYPKPFTLDWSPVILPDKTEDPCSIRIDILAQIFRILLYANSSYKSEQDLIKNEKLDEAYERYRDGVNRSWDQQGATISKYWKTAADEEKRYINQYYNSSNKARIVQDIKTLFGFNKIKLNGSDSLIQIPRGLYISLGQNPWAPYYSEDPKIGGLLSKDYKDQNFREDERLNDITLTLSLDDQVTITELGGSTFNVAIQEDPTNGIQKELKFIFKPYARGADSDSNTIAIAKAVVKEDGKTTGDYHDFHYDNFVRASRDLEKKKDNNFFIYNYNLKNKKADPGTSSNIYTYVRCIHLSPDVYKKDDYQSIARSWVEKKQTSDSKKTVEIDFDNIFTEPSLNQGTPSEKVAINLSSRDFMIDHTCTVNRDDTGKIKEKINETTYRNVSVYLVGVLNYHTWKGSKSFGISAYTEEKIDTTEGASAEKHVVAPKMPYSILGVPIIDDKAYSKLDEWLSKALSINSINASEDEKITVSPDNPVVIYPQRASSTLLKNWKIGNTKSLANDINKAVIFDPYYAFKKNAITYGDKYGTAPVNYYYVAVAIDYTKKETLDAAGKITEQTCDFVPIKINFTEKEGEKQDRILYSLPVTLDEESKVMPSKPKVEEP